MVINVDNVNTGALHYELIQAGLIPKLVTSSGVTTSLTFDDGVSSANVQIVIDAHDPYIIYGNDCSIRDKINSYLENKSLQELRELFRGLDTTCQLRFREAFSSYWGDKSATQTDVNLVFESVFRVLLNALYIKEVEGRALTTAEETEYHTLLNHFKDHNDAIDPYLPRTSWCLPLIDRIIGDFNSTRFSDVFPKLAFITGKVTVTCNSTVETIEGSIATIEVT